jgi:phosphoribosylformylglycinamidine synthase subunit PurL
MTTGEPEVTEGLVRRHGLSEDEYERIKRVLGRPPNFTELGIFSVMWSEHCSYKNSKRELRKLPVTGSRVLVKAGEENAGVIDIGDGWAIAFKIESHNHPSAIEPFQGAATGVGGIVRDIFTMGARPVFNLNSLRFGPITPREGEPPGEPANLRLGRSLALPAEDVNTDNIQTNRRIFSGVVAGISHYGNCIGIPTIGGEIYFDESYEGNPLVNVFSLGILRHEQIARGSAQGVGNPVFYVGAETGRDGLAGAAFASRELTTESKQDRPAVQVGDPFKEKLLLEACLELLESGCVAGIQDMGAAGLTCSACETASRAGTGIEIDLDKVPKREPGMTPYEIMLSESQERMLIIVKKGEERKVQTIFEKWDLRYSEIGAVKDDGMMRVLHEGAVVAEIPARLLAEEAPVYERDAAPRTSPDVLSTDTVPETDPAEVLPQLLAHPSIASKQWVYQQYDHMVRIGAVVTPGSDAAVFLVREANKILAATTDCNAIYCALDPREGAKIAVAEAARNLTCSGAVPLALTDNLNFGNPYKPENFWQLRESVEGMTEACRFFEVPVTGGNVSLYNENPAGAIDPTPTVGMVGLVENPRHITTQNFKQNGDAILLIGEIGHELGGSHYMKIVHGRKEGLPPRLNLGRERDLQTALRALIRSGFIRSAHDCSEGGIGIALAECCVSGERPIGAEIDLTGIDLRADVLLFNETQSRVIVSVPKTNAAAALALLEWRNVTARRLGFTGGRELSIWTNGATYSWSVASLAEAWYGAIPRCLS